MDPRILGGHRLGRGGTGGLPPRLPRVPIYQAVWEPHTKSHAGFRGRIQEM